jgi:DNA-binding Lrp family transcriptional regulator
LICAYLLVKVRPHHDRDVLAKISQLAPVKEATTLFGEYDLIAKIEVGGLDELDGFVFDIIRQIPGVESTTTLLDTRSPVKGQKIQYPPKAS